jgi:nitroreductase/ferredoxin
MKSKVTPPVVIKENCIGCERCVTTCPGLVLETIDAKSTVVRGGWCIGCGHCGAVCPAEAIFPEGSPLDKHPKEGEVPEKYPEILELLFRERRSVRRYTSTPVPEEMLNKILDAGRYAPTGTNSQNVHYIILKTPDKIATLQKMTVRFYEKIFSRVRGRLGRFIISFIAGRRIAAYLHESLPKVEYRKQQMSQGKDPLFFRAPVVMLAHAESWDPNSSFNCSVALYHCSLMAHTLGLGCCFNGFLVNAVNHSPKMKAWLGLPPNHRCYSAMTLGFPEVRYLRLVRRALPKVNETHLSHKG